MGHVAGMPQARLGVKVNPDQLSGQAYPISGIQGRLWVSLVPIFLDLIYIISKCFFGCLSVILFADKLVLRTV
jgi:hypothetical protein